MPSCGHTSPQIPQRPSLTPGKNPDHHPTSIRRWPRFPRIAFSGDVAMLPGGRSLASVFFPSFTSCCMASSTSLIHRCSASSFAHITDASGSNDPSSLPGNGWCPNPNPVVTSQHGGTPTQHEHHHSPGPDMINDNFLYTDTFIWLTLTILRMVWYIHLYSASLSEPSRTRRLREETTVHSGTHPLHVAGIRRAGTRLVVVQVRVVGEEILSGTAIFLSLDEVESTTASEGSGGSNIPAKNDRCIHGRQGLTRVDKGVRLKAADGKSYGRIRKSRVEREKKESSRASGRDGRDEGKLSHLRPVTLRFRPKAGAGTGHRSLAHSHQCHRNDGHLIP